MHQQRRKIGLLIVIVYPMKMFCLIGHLFFLSYLSAQTVNDHLYKNDFDYFCHTINDNYSYWDKKQTDWNRVKDVYGARMDTVTSKHTCVLLIEKDLNEIYDNNSSLNTNTKYEVRNTKYIR